MPKKARKESFFTVGKRRRRTTLLVVIPLAAIVALISPGIISLYEASQMRAGIGDLGSTHIHQQFTVFLNDQQVDLSQSRYQLRDQFAHFENGQGDRQVAQLHLHATDITLRYVIWTLGISYDPSKAVVIVNGTEIPEGLLHKPADGDEIAVRLFT